MTKVSTLLSFPNSTKQSTGELRAPQKGNKMPRLWYESETEEEYNSRFKLSPYDSSIGKPNGTFRLARGANSLKEIAKNEAGTNNIITILKNNRDYNTMQPIKEYRMVDGKLKFMAHLDVLMEEDFD
tara:strand:- start:597 stop:977 length:381 start_codon:yes stop_codon:yes gene_type:complete